ncbi:MAG: hypothetical protein WA798_14050 [Candidatus Acidiferrum sp.]
MPAFAKILEGLEKLYGKQRPTGPGDPYEMILFVNCGYPATDASCTKGYEALKREVGTSPEKILATPKAKLAAATKAGGMAPELRADRLKAIAEMVGEEFGGDLKWSLRRLLEGDRRHAEEGIRLAKKALKEFPVIGEPGADKILLFAGLAPVAAVPSACPGVPQRIFFGEENKNYGAGYRAAREGLEAELPEEFGARQRAYLLLKRHGQEICKRTKPKCELCPVSKMCAYFRGLRETKQI